MMKKNVVKVFIMTWMMVMVFTTATVAFVGSKGFVCPAFDSGFLLKGDRNVDIAKRNLQLVRPLSRDEIIAIRSYLSSGKRKSYGFVTSEFYFKLIDSKTVREWIYGAVIRSDGAFMGIDVTSDNVSVLPATGMHELVVGDKEYSLPVISIIEE